MPETHEVRQGECISSIAEKYGFFPDTIWNHGENSELKRLRENGYVLLPGDEVHIPDLRRLDESKACEKRHRFRRKGVPEILKLRLLKDGEPRKNLPYRLIIDGKTFEGSTDGDGKIEQEIPPNARSGRLILEPSDEPEEEYRLDLGSLDPIEELTGVQKRLSNLGYFEGSPNGRESDELEAAVRLFQKDQGIEQTGEIDDELRDKIKSAHGS